MLLALRTTMKCKRKIRRNGSQEHQRRGKRNAGILKNVPDVQNGVERRKTKSFGPCLVRAQNFLRWNLTNLKY